MVRSQLTIMEIFVLIAVFAGLVGGGIGWLCRGRLVLTFRICIAVALVAQTVVIICAGPEIEHFTLNYLIGYAIFMGPFFLLCYLLPCVTAGLITNVVARRLCNHQREI